MLIALALAAAAAAPAVPVRTTRLDVHRCATAACDTPTRRSRYRLEPQDDLPTDMKQAALTTDGSACSVIGGKVCTRKPRTIFSTDFTD